MNALSRIPKPVERFSSHQIAAAELALSSLGLRGICWVILLAQMQSGKTETFLLIACEMLRNGLLNNVVIFSGNSETDLRDQLKAQIAAGSRFYRKYTRYLREVHDMEEDERADLIADITGQQMISVVWGSELDSFRGPTSNTLFIWEEAHYAQTKEQRPDRFLQRIGISADGNPERLEANGNRMITISATPFSELSDYLRLGQHKRVVKMEPGDGYVSVKAIRDTNRLKTFKKSYTEVIHNALLLKSPLKNSYGIIRVSHKNEAEVKQYVEAAGWSSVVYDSVSKDRHEREHGKAVWNDMATEPTANTVILIRGMCRMGKNLEKKHLAFVMETARNTGTDTILQSLLGRVCGYSDGSDRVLVYLSASCLPEIDRYIELWDHEGISIIPTRACNMTDRKAKCHVPIIPIQVPIDRALYPTNDRSDLLRCLRANFEAGTVVNKNSEAMFQEVRAKVLTSDKKLIVAHYADGRKEHQMARLRNVRDAYAQSEARDFGSGCGMDSVEANNVRYWIPKANAVEFAQDVMYITAHATREDMCDFLIPATTKREVFYTRPEEEEESDMSIPIHTTQAIIDETPIQGRLCEAISRSLESPVRRGIDIQVPKSTYKTLMKDLKKGGSIYNYVKSNYCGTYKDHVYDRMRPIEIEVKKSTSQPMALNRAGLLLVEVSW
jgi:hypothetical protein